MTILVLEDDTPFREMLRAVLNARGHDVLAVDDPMEALALAASTVLDGVLTGFRMPGMNGLNFCRALARQNADLALRVPIWILTGTPTLTVEEARAAGADAVFRKPFSPVELSKAIERRLPAKPATAA